MKQPEEKTAADWIAERGGSGGVDIIERSDLVREGYGIEVIGLTRDHLEALLAGKALDTDALGEYAVLIYLEEVTP